MPEAEDEREERAEARRLHNIRMPEVIIAPSDKALENPEYIRLLAVTLWCVRWLGRSASRRYFVEIGSDVLRDYRGSFRNPNGSPFVIKDIDGALGGPNFDVLRALFALPLSNEPWVPQFASRQVLKAASVLVQAGGPVLWRDLKDRFPSP